MFGFKKRHKPKAYIIEPASGYRTSACAGDNVGRAVDTSDGFSEPTRILRPGNMGRLNRRTRVRIGMVAVVFAGVYLGLGVRLIDIAFDPSLQTRNLVRQKIVNGPRPEIIDRQGVLLATNLPAVALVVAGQEVWDAQETAIALSRVIEGVDPVALEAKLAKGQYVEVRSDLSPVEQADIFALGLPGVNFSQRDQRFYPHDKMASHLIGYLEGGAVRPASGGMIGLEKLIDRRATGETLKSTIDVRAQQVLETVLVENMEKYSAEAAWGGVIDITNGEMIAIASLPDFNLNVPNLVGADERRSRMTYDRFDLGSAFKVITAASVLEAGFADEETPYDARGSLNVAGAVINDYHGKNRILTLSEVVQHSSNIGAVKMAQELGVARQKDYLSSLGFFDALPIEIAENRKPDLPKKWGPVESATVSYGHGIAVTPLHLLAGFAAVVNEGVYHVPVMVMDDDRGAKEDYTKARRVFSPATTARMRRIMRRTVTNGTATRAEVEGYFPIGKTATADKPGRGGYQENARISSFVGAFPGYAPRYAILVSLDNPQPTTDRFNNATAGWTAAPMFAKLVERLGPILDVPVVDKTTALRGFFADEREGNEQEQHHNERKDNEGKSGEPVALHTVPSVADVISSLDLGTDATPHGGVSGSALARGGLE